MFGFNSDTIRSTILLVAVGLFSYVFFITAWICDDAFITFRTINNLMNGYGLVWNVDERVQTYTHPAWLFLLSACKVISGELYFSTIIVSFLLSLTAVLLLLNRYSDNAPRALLLLLILLSSKAFVDYTSSGLENPLSYLFVALFYPWYVAANWRDRPLNRSMFLSSLTVSTAYLIRPDLPLLFVAPWAHILINAKKEKTRGLLVNIVLGFIPILVWTMFSLVYYGFVFPNSYYAKLAPGIPVSTVVQSALRYLWVCLLFDPLTLVVIALASVLSLAVTKRTEAVASTISVLLYITYVISIGGDFMGGRFFSVPFLIASFQLVYILRIDKRIYWVAPLIALAVYNWTMPLVPIKVSDVPGWNHLQYYGISDERGSYAKELSLRPVWKNRGVIKHPWAEEARRLSQPDSTTKGAHRMGVGLFGYYGGDLLIIDFFGLVDPLLARLPVLEGQKRLFRPGHLLKALPEGYFKSRMNGRIQMNDIRIQNYYKKIRLITRGNLFSFERWKAIYDMNLGSDRRFNGTYRGYVPLLIRIDKTENNNSPK